MFMTLLIWIGMLTFFYLCIIWLFTRDAQQVFWSFVIICLFWGGHYRFLSGNITAAHDAIDTVLLNYEYEQFFQTASIFEFDVLLNSWEPYSNFGLQNIFRAYPIFNFFNVVNAYIGLMPLKPILLSNLMILAEVIGFGIGISLLSGFFVKYKHIRLFILAICLFSNLLPSSMVQASSSKLLFFPYLVFFLLKWFRTGQVASFIITVVLLGLELAFYLPNMVVISLSLFLLLYGFFTLGARDFFSRIFSIRPRLPHVLISSLFFAALIAPQGYIYYELKARYNPSRGVGTQSVSTNFSEVKDLPDSLRGHPVYPSDVFSFITDKPFSTAYNVWHYAGAYAAYFALFAMLFGFFSDRRKYVLILSLTAAILGIIALGFQTPLFFLFNHIPILNALRHYMFFINYTFFFLILLGAVGFDVWVDRLAHSSFRQKVPVLIFSLAFGLFYFVNADPKILTTSGTMIVLLAMSHAFKQIQRFSVRDIQSLSIALVIVAAITQLIPYQLELLDLMAKPYPLPQHNPVRIPTSRNCIYAPLLPVEKPLEFLSVAMHLPDVTKQACIFRSPFSYGGGSFPHRANELLNHVYPCRTGVEAMTKNLAECYSQGEPLLGYHFPLFFFVPKTEMISKECFQDSACFEQILSEMTAHYRQAVPQNVYFFEGDRLPPNISSSESSAPISEIVPVNIEQEKSNLHEIYGKIDAPSDGFIVRLENYHRGWHISIDGKPKEQVYYGNYAFQAFPVSQGQHRLHWTFETSYPIFFLLHQLGFYLGMVLFLWVGFRYAPAREESREKDLEEQS